MNDQQCGELDSTSRENWNKMLFNLIIRPLLIIHVPFGALRHLVASQFAESTAVFLHEPAAFKSKQRGSMTKISGYVFRSLPLLVLPPNEVFHLSFLPSPVNLVTFRL